MKSVGETLEVSMIKLEGGEHMTLETLQRDENMGMNMQPKLLFKILGMWFSGRRGSIRKYGFNEHLQL